MTEDEHNQFLLWLKTDVSTWTENKMLGGVEPTLEGFVAVYKDYDHDELIKPIVAEMERVKAIVANEITIEDELEELRRMSI